MQDHNIREDIACGAHLCVAAFHMSARDQFSDGDTANLSACVYCVDFAFCFCMEFWLFIIHLVAQVLMCTSVLVSSENIALATSFPFTDLLYNYLGFWSRLVLINFLIILLDDNHEVFIWWEFAFAFSSGQ